MQLLLESVGADLGPGPDRGGPAPERVTSKQLRKELCASVPTTCLLPVRGRLRGPHGLHLGRPVWGVGAGLWRFAGIGTMDSTVPPGQLSMNKKRSMASQQLCHCKLRICNIQSAQ